MSDSEDVVVPNDELIECARIGELEDAIAWIEEGADVNAVDEGGKTALMGASANGHVEVVKMLLSRKAEVTSKNASGSTALHWAALNGHAEICMLLMQAGADVEVKNNFGRTAKQEATVAGRLEAFMVLDRIQDADVDERIAKVTAKADDAEIGDEDEDGGEEEEGGGAGGDGDEAVPMAADTEEAKIINELSLKEGGEEKN